MRIPTKRSALKTYIDAGLQIGTVIDVGVQFSTFELIECFPDAHHVLFEPVEECLPWIQENYKNVSHEIHNVACAEKNGELYLNIYMRNEDGVITHSAIQDAPDGAEVRPIRLVRVDDIVDSKIHKGPYLLKVDVDGVELRVLEGCEKLWPDVAAVVIEAQVWNIHERMQAVVKAGFELAEVIDITYYDNQMWQCDMLFLAKHLRKKVAMAPQNRMPFDFSKYRSLYD
jgi:FkbM family methyltransferase